MQLIGKSTDSNPGLNMRLKIHFVVCFHHINVTTIWHVETIMCRPVQSQAAALTPSQRAPSVCVSDGLSVSFTGSTYTSCLKSTAADPPRRVSCIYCWRKGVQGGLMGRERWTTPQELWAGQWDSCTHKERSAAIWRLLVCNKKGVNTKYEPCEFIVVYWEQKLFFFLENHPLGCEVSKLLITDFYT